MYTFCRGFQDGNWTNGDFLGGMDERGGAAGGVLLPGRVSEEKMGKGKSRVVWGDVDWCDEGAGRVSVLWCVAVSFRNGFGVDNAKTS
jgi:hypothetical protein